MASAPAPPITTTTTTESYFQAKRQMRPPKGEPSDQNMMGNITKLLPANTFLMFQTLAPLATNDGVCQTVERVVTAVMLCILASTCVVVCFTDTYQADNGKVYHGVVTFKGLWNPAFEDSGIEGVIGSTYTGCHGQYKLKFQDVLHAFLSGAAFATLTLLTSPVSTCFYKHVPGTIVKTLPLLVGSVITSVFAFSPGARNGLTHPLPPLKPTKTTTTTDSTVKVTETVTAPGQDGGAGGGAKQQPSLGQEALSLFSGIEDAVTGKGGPGGMQNLAKEAVSLVKHGVQDLESNTKVEKAVKDGINKFDESATSYAKDALAVSGISNEVASIQKGMTNAVNEIQQGVTNASAQIQQAVSNVATQSNLPELARQAASLLQEGATAVSASQATAAVYLPAAKDAIIEIQQGLINGPRSISSTIVQLPEMAQEAASLLQQTARDTVSMGQASAAAYLPDITRDASTLIQQGLSNVASQNSSLSPGQLSGIVQEATSLFNQGAQGGQAFARGHWANARDAVIHIPQANRSPTINEAMVSQFQLAVMDALRRQPSAVSYLPTVARDATALFQQGVANVATQTPSLSAAAQQAASLYQQGVQSVGEGQAMASGYLSGARDAINHIQQGMADAATQSTPFYTQAQSAAGMTASQFQQALLDSVNRSQTSAAMYLPTLANEAMTLLQQGSTNSVSGQQPGIVSSVSQQGAQNLSDTQALATGYLAAARDSAIHIQQGVTNSAIQTLATPAGQLSAMAQDAASQFQQVEGLAQQASSLMQQASQSLSDGEAATKNAATHIQQGVVDAAATASKSIADGVKEIVTQVHEASSKVGDDVVDSSVCTETTTTTTTTTSDQK